MARVTKIEKRLLGTWKSDKRKTFSEFVPWKGLTKKKLKFLRSLFGKLTVTYTPSKIRIEYEDLKDLKKYEILGSDLDSVAVLAYDSLRIYRLSDDLGSRDHFGTPNLAFFLGVGTFSTASLASIPFSCKGKKGQRGCLTNRSSPQKTPPPFERLSQQFSKAY